MNNLLYFFELYGGVFLSYIPFTYEKFSMYIISNLHLTLKVLLDVYNKFNNI